MKQPTAWPMSLITKASPPKRVPAKSKAAIALLREGLGSCKSLSLCGSMLAVGQRFVPKDAQALEIGV